MTQLIKLVSMRFPHRKVGSIQILRDATGYMLKKATDIVDTLEQISKSTRPSPSLVAIEVRDMDRSEWSNFASWFEYNDGPQPTPIILKVEESKHLAILLHTKLCRNNHADGCSWMYHKTSDPLTWLDTPFLTYLVKANKMLVWVNFQIAQKIVEAL